MLIVQPINKSGHTLPDFVFLLQGLTVFNCFHYHVNRIDNIYICGSYAMFMT